MCFRHEELKDGGRDDTHTTGEFGIWSMQWGAAARGRRGKPSVRFLPQGALKFEGEFEESFRNMNLQDNLSFLYTCVSCMFIKADK